MWRLIVVVMTLSSVCQYGWAADKVQKLVQSYYAEQVLWSRLLANPPKPRPLPDEPPGSQYPAPTPAPPSAAPECPPPSGHLPNRCIEAVCQQMSRFECDDRDDMLEVARACRNVNGECVRSICSRMSRFNCDEKVEVFEVTEGCRGLSDISCIDYVCSKLSRFQCDELRELREIAEQCK